LRRWRREPLEADVLDALVCDRCGRSVPGYDGIERQLVDAMTFGTVATFAASWGYGSRRDGERWHADLCERCAEDVRQLIAAGDGPGIQGDGEDHR
jgi:hypothetical protein